MEMGRRSGGSSRSANPVANNNNRRRAIITEQRVTEGLRENKIDSFNPLVQHREGIKSSVTYYQSIAEANDSDTTNTSDLSGNVASRYNKIENMIVYFNDALDPEFTLEKLNTITSTGSIYTVPGPMIPKAQDMIHLKTTDIDITLKFTSIAPMIHSQDSGYQVEVETYTIGIPEELSDRIEGEFVFDFVNIGTHKTTIIEKSIWAKLTNLYAWLDDVQDSYDMLFWNDNLGSYSFEIPIDQLTPEGDMLKKGFKNQWDFGNAGLTDIFLVTDPYNNKFITDCGFFFGKSPALHMDKREKNWMDRTFNRSIYGAMIDRKEEYMKFIYPDLKDYYNDVDFQVTSNQIHLETLYVEYSKTIDGIDTANSFIRDDAYYPSDTIDAIKNRSMDNTNLYKVVQDVIHNEPSQLFDPDNLEYFEALLDCTILGNDAKELSIAYYMTPLLVYALLYTINEVILKDSTSQSIYDQRLVL